MKKSIITTFQSIFFASLLASSVQAQFSLTTSTYTQNFDGLGTATSAALTGGHLGLHNVNLSGWYFLETGSSADTSFAAGTGSLATANTYSVGTAGGTDRSLGSLQSGTVIPSFGFWFQNNTGSTISGIDLSYKGETWRIGATGRSDALNFSTSTSATTLGAVGAGTWTDVSSLNYVNASATATANASKLQSSTISGNLGALSLANGARMFLRWSSSDAAGADDLLAINDFSLSASLLQSAASYTWTGTGSGGTWQNGQSGSFGTTYNNATDSTVTFAGTAENVALSGTVQTGSLAFTSGGYALNSGNVTVGLGAITTDTGTTTINSVLEGTAGLIKSGAGALVLTGANTVTGAVSITGGTLQIGSDGALGNAANDIANNGTLKTTSNIALGAGRDITGSGTLDIADGTTLTVNGVTSTSGLTLANTGTLAFNNAASNPGNLTTTYTSGTAQVTGNLNLGATDKIVNVAGGGALEVAGTVSLTTGTGTELTKEGAGTLILSGSGSSISRVQIGRTGATPTAGGTLRVADSASLGAQEMYFNYGTLEAANNLSTSAGVSLGGRTGAETVIGGSGGSADVTFNGAARFFGATGTGGEFVLKVNNQTTFAGGISGASATGTGSFTGVTVGGAGTLNISGNSAAMTSRITTSDTVKLVVNSTLGSAVNVGNGSLLGGSGSVGALTLSTGATLTPGNSPGLLTATSATFQSGSNLNWEIFNAVGTAGVEWDLLSVTGNLNVAALSSGSMNLVLKSLSALPDTVGALAGFNSNDNYSWTFARAASITGATGDLTSGQDVTSLFSINGTSFNLGTAPTSGWKVMTGTETVSGTTYQTLNLLAVPEPSAQSLLAFGMAALVAVRAVRRGRGNS